MTDIDTAETTVQTSTTSVPTRTFTDSSSFTPSKERTVSLEKIMVQASRPKKPSTSTEIKAHVMQTIDQLKGAFQGDYKDMAAIYYNLCQHTYVFAGIDHTNKSHAIKVWAPAPWFTNVESALKHQRFVKEIDLIDGMHKLTHGENIAKVTGVGTRTTSKDVSFVYFTTPYLQRKLSDIDPTKFSLKKLVEIHEKIARVLSFMHKNYHMLHRDLKPDNILLDNESDPSLIDFGAIEQTGLENRSAEIGTIPFLSPAQAEGMLNLLLDEPPLVLDYSTDVYSLGATFGAVLFKNHPGDRLAELAEHYHKKEKPDLFYARLVLGPEIHYPSTGNNKIDEFLHRSMTQEKDKYASMEEAADALKAIKESL